jgi:hypothetical protein
MYKNCRYLCSIIFVLLSFCAQQDSRKMWQPSHAYIGVEPNDDAPVKAGVESLKNFAQDKTLTVAYEVSMSYLKFFLPGFSKLDSAVLRIQTKDVFSAGSVSVYEVKNKDWDETQITWDSCPKIGKTALVSLMIDEPNKVYEIDLTELVRQKLASGDFYICLCFKANDEGTDVSFASVEDYDNLKPRFMVGGLTYVPPAPPAYSPAEFKHPSILVTQEQIDFVKTKIQAGQSPWKEAFDAALKSESAQIGYKPSPFEKLTFTGHYRRSVSTGYKEINNDAKATFVNTLLWVLTDNSRYAQKAIEIINAWSETNKEITG